MVSKKKTGLTELLVSGKMEAINSRFLVKASVFDDGVHPKSVMLCMRDLLEDGFSIKFFKSQEEAAGLLRLLHTASI